MMRWCSCRSRMAPRETLQCGLRANLSRTTSCPCLSRTGSSVCTISFYTSFSSWCGKEVTFMAEPFLVVTLAIIVATLAAIVYVLRYVVLMERRTARIEVHIERLVHAVLKE